MSSNGEGLAVEFVEFLNKDGSPFHTVNSVIDTFLKPTGFQNANEWLHSLPSMGYFTQNDSAIFAFKIGTKFKSSSGERKIILLAAHTDSPALVVRVSNKASEEGCELLGVDTYGGGLWYTWLDRGLGVAGRAILKGGWSKLFRISEPLVYIPSQCIHLQSAEERGVLKLDNETNLRPVAGLVAKTEGGGDKGARKDNEGSITARFCGPVLKRIAENLSVQPDDILSVDCRLFDTNPSRIGGCSNEFIEGQGLDNKTSVYGVFKALTLVDCPENCLFIACAFDHEEIGSSTKAGANSVIVSDWLNLLLEDLNVNSTSDRMKVFERSLVGSFDAAHAVHPNYASKFQSQNKPKINEGVALKFNSNHKYGTNSVSEAFMRAISDKISFQTFCVKNSSACGSTIGPMLETRTGMETLDAGIPIWAMHSIREICGTADIKHLVDFALALFLFWDKSRGVH